MGALGPGPVPLWCAVRDGYVLQNCHGRHFHGVFQEGESGSPLLGKVSAAPGLLPSWQRPFSPDLLSLDAFERRV